MKRVPSNRMPELPARPMPWWGWILLLTVVGGFLVWTFPVGPVAIVALVVFSLIAIRGSSKRLQCLAADREGESICTFVRSFDYRTLDTWILRAVYEEVCDWVPHQVPVRSRDMYDETLEIDDEDFVDLVENAARRAGRSLAVTNGNPYFDRVRTVEDLVLFLHHQPRVTQPT